MEWNFRRLRKNSPTAKNANSPRPRQVQTIVMAGQSNMIGLGKPAELPAESREMPKNIHFHEQVWNADDDIEDMVRRGTFGPELSFGQKVSSSSREKELLLIKFAAASTTIGSWLREAKIHPPAGHGSYRKNLFARMIEFIDPLCSRYQTEISAFVWVQGRRDAGSKEHIDTYKDNLALFISQLRDHWGKPELPFIYAQVPEHPGDLPMVLAELLFRFPFNHDLRQKQAEFEIDKPFVEMVSTEGLRPCPDFIYLNTPSTYTLGQRLAERYLEQIIMLKEEISAAE